MLRLISLLLSAYLFNVLNRAAGSPDYRSTTSSHSHYRQVDERSFGAARRSRKEKRLSGTSPWALSLGVWRQMCVAALHYWEIRKNPWSAFKTQQRHSRGDVLAHEQHFVLKLTTFFYLESPILEDILLLWPLTGLYGETNAMFITTCHQYPCLEVRGIMGTERKQTD